LNLRPLPPEGSARATPSTRLDTASVPRSHRHLNPKPRPPIRGLQRIAEAVLRKDLFDERKPEPLPLLLRRIKRREQIPLGLVIETAAGTPAVEIIISDSGIGIDPEHHTQIFEKLYQISEVAIHSSGQTKFKGGGSGLGLAIAQGIVVAHGGQIWVESAGYDEATYPGSNFYIVLPLKQPE